MAVDSGTRHVQAVHEASDLAQVLRMQAAERPTQAAFIFLRDGETEDSAITYAELDRRARAVAARLQDMGLAGERLLLAFPPGLEFVEGLFGCLYAGCVAVPTSLAHRRRRLERFGAIVADAQPRMVLSTADAAAQFADGARGPRLENAVDAMASLKWIATEDIGDEWADRWSEDPLPSDSLAMLQFTSGSTSEPKGIMLTHANLLYNARAICEAFQVGPAGSGEERAVFWLPTYHDMGLVGGVLAPVYSAITNVTMSPTTFLQSPITWLKAITQYRATISGGPNFAYDLCVRKIDDEQKRGLDLSSWTLAFVGAEPVQAETLERFAAAFKRCGFRRSAFYPCYGLAEATLMVSGPKRGEGPIVRPSATHPNGKNGSPARQLVACGSPVGGSRVVIVDPETGHELPPGEIGEIWVAGPSVGQGYWNRVSLTRQAFGASIGSGTDDVPKSSDSFLRTGDLGLIENGRLFITGRRDDLIIVRGVNRYPQDIEVTARESHPLLAHHGGAAFAVSDDTGHRHVLVHEVTRNGMKDYSPVMDAAAEAVLDEHDLALDAIVLVRTGTIPRTSSGKIQRRVCHDAFLAGELHVVAESSNGRVPEERHSTENTNHSVRRSAPGSDAFAAICDQVRLVGGRANGDLTPETSISALALDSLQRVELVAALEKTFAGRLPDTCHVQSLGELAGIVQEHLIDRTGPDTSVGEVPAEHYEVARFPEYLELQRHEREVRDVVGDNPYFRVDEGDPNPGARSTSLRVGGRDLVNFCCYDYLGMARDPAVADAARDAVARYGTSAGASRLVSGEKRVHSELERAFANFLGTEDAVAFVSGHATNVTTIGHLIGRGDLIVHDSLAHNSIIQGAQLSGASHRAFPHNNWQALDALLSDLRGRYRRVLIAIEGVYSMDGDWPDLPRFLELKKKHKTLLLVDEAHSLGVLGKTGRGIAEHFGVDRAQADLWMGTLSKAMASCGGFIAGSSELVQYLKYTAPGFVYSVGLSPPNAAAALASVNLLEREPNRVNRLREKATLFLELARQRGLDTGLAMPGGPVVPVIVGNSVDSLRLSRALFDRGINVHPILRPAVPEDAARLRFFITINHSEDEIRAAVDAVAAELARLR